MASLVERSGVQIKSCVIINDVFVYYVWKPLALGVDVLDKIISLKRMSEIGCRRKYIITQKSDWYVMQANLRDMDGT